MKRQITIYESSRNGKITVFNDVECNTLAELKSLLREKGIDYSDKEFVEGVTNTKLIADDSRIPTNIPFKGKTTNDVFINILNKDTKIKSGIDYEELSRAELLHIAKPYALQIEVRCGSNYTRAKSSDIIAFLTGLDKGTEEEEPKEEPKAPCCNNNLELLKEAVMRLAEILKVEDEIEEVFEDWKTEAPVQMPEGEKSNFSMEDIQQFINK